LSPFVSVAITLKGDIRLCGCANWMPTTVGNIFETPMHELLKSSLSKEIRQSIIDGTYTFCDESTCGIIRNDFLNSIDDLLPSVAWQVQDADRYLMPGEIFISGDLTCNLSCPSCRTKVIKLTDEQKKEQEKYIETFRKNIFSQPTDQEINITLSTTGELFASNFLLKFVSGISLEQFPNVNLSIQTNGLLCEQNWHKLEKFQNRVRQITVTIDAAQADTYEKLRRGGKWSDLLKSMSWLQQQKKQNGMKMYTRMVVQKDNFKQMEDFYKLSKSFDADQVEYARITDWKVMTPKDFFEIDVQNPKHVMHNDYLKSWETVRHYKDAISFG